MDDLFRSSLAAIRQTLDGGEPRIDVCRLLRMVSERIKLGTISAVAHPVGFVMIDLSNEVDSEAGVQFRLHVWPEPYEREDGLGAIHDHSWKLASAVIVGQLIDINYEARKDARGRGFVRAKYVPGGNEFYEAGRYQVSVMRERCICAPSVYRLKPRVLHSTRVSVFPTATLVIADRRVAGDRDPLIIVDGDRIPASAKTMPVISTNDAVAIVDRLVDRVPTKGAVET